MKGGGGDEPIEVQYWLLASAIWSAIFKYIAAVLYNMLFSKYPAIFQLLFSLLIVIFYIACDYENNREIECYFQLLFSLLIVLFYIVC